MQQEGARALEMADGATQRNATIRPLVTSDSYSGAGMYTEWRDHFESVAVVQSSYG